MANKNPDEILLKQLKTLLKDANENGLNLAEQFLETEIYKLERKIAQGKAFD